MEFISKNQIIQTPIQLFTKILLPFSLLSLILCNFQIQTLAYGLQLFSFSVGKNYMFLLCNGLLVFIATSSGLIGSFWVESDIKVTEKTLKISSQRKSEDELSSSSSSEPKGSILKQKVIAEEEEEDPPLVVVEDEGEEDGSNELVSVEEDEDEQLGFMSNEELNKKCEEFIRKMRQGIRIEARNHMITVQ